MARAAVESGVAQIKLDPDEYREALERRLGKSQEIMRMIVHKAQRDPKRVVFPEGDQDKILRAFSAPLNPGDRVFYDLNTAAMVLPVAYAPQAAAIALGRGCGLGPLALTGINHKADTFLLLKMIPLSPVF